MAPKGADTEVDMKTISWFSAGASSAVATKLLIDEIDQIIYTHIDDQHPDAMRFLKDCEQWFGKEILILQSPYKTVEAACYAAGGRGYVNGPRGAACTRTLKKQVRVQWEYEQPLDIPLRYVWGMDANEVNRVERVKVSMPDREHVFPLIDRGYSKEQVHQIMKASGIKRPLMYDLGYSNNNCIGCVKGGAGYWNKIRVDFPEVFAQRAAMERKIQATCLKGVYLDELHPDKGRGEPMIMDDCGILCEVMAL